MEGTEKQIKWAKDIRNEKITAMNTHLNNLLKTPNTPKEQIEKIQKQSEKMTTLWMAITKATFWIDNRNSFWQVLAKETLNK